LDLTAFLVGVHLGVEDVLIKKSEDHWLHRIKHFNAHSAQRHSGQNTIGNDMKIHFISRSNAGFAVLKDHEVKKKTVLKSDVFSVGISILTMHISKHIITQHARIGLFKNAHSIAKII
jgi:hypothetical protein